MSHKEAPRTNVNSFQENVKDQMSNALMTNWLPGKRIYF